MSDLPSRGVFLSYRREDAAPYARLLQFLLRERLPDAPVFMDLDSIEAGLDFAEVIRKAVNSCAVLVALIGRQWATVTDEEGRQRLHNSDDYVRFEIQTALEREVRVIPVLVDGATPPRRQQLPPDLHKLTRLNAFELSYRRFEYDADQLLELIMRVLAAAQRPEQAEQLPPQIPDYAVAKDRDVEPPDGLLEPDLTGVPPAIPRRRLVRRLGAARAAAPWPDYDNLTIASIRARLRNLDAEQIRWLGEYEKAHAARPEVIAMFERRVAKLDAEP